MQQLLDLQQIRDLKAKYCYYVDEYFEDPTNFDRLMREVFTDDTELDFGEVGGAKGRAEVENFFRNVVFSTLTFSQHLVHSPLITFKGADVIHSYWIPRLTGTQDIVPGRENELTFSADEPGRYTFYCTVEGHREAGMEGTLIVEAP